MVRNSSLSIRLFTAFVFILLLKEGFSQSAGETDQKLKLIVHEFVLDTVLSNSNIPLGISSGVQKSIEQFNEIELLNKDDFADLTIKNLQSGTMPDSIPGVDAVVFGTYISINEFVKIQPVIYNVNEKYFHVVSPTRGTTEGLAVLTEGVADNIFESLIEICPVLQQFKKKIAFIADFETVSGVYKNIGPIKNASKVFTRQVVQDVDYNAPANAYILSESELVEYSDRSSVEMIKELGLDMLITLTFVFENNQVVGLKTDFNILEKDRNRIVKRDFNLPGIKADYYSDFGFLDFASNELSYFLNRIIDPSGQWDYILFPNKTSTKPTKVDLLIYKAENFAQKNDFYLSSYYYYEALNEFTERVDPAEIRLQIGFNKVYQYRLEEAVEEFDFVLSQTPDNGYAYLGKSLVDYYNGNYTEALNYLELAGSKGFENKFLIDAMKGYYYFELGKYEDAISSFNTALNEEQKKIKIRIVNNMSISNIKVHVGLCYLALNQFDDAIIYYTALIREFPYHNDLPYYLGNAYSKKGIEEFFTENYSQAIHDFMESRKSYPNPNINEYLRFALLIEKEFEKAGEFIASEVEKGNYDPNFIWFTHAMDIRLMLIDASDASANSEYDQNIGSQAIKMYRLSLESDPNNAKAYYYIGELSFLLDSTELGFESMNKAFEINNTDFEIQLGLVQAYLLANQFRKCEKLIKRSARINKKLIVDARTKALMDYLLISVSMAQDKKARKETKELNSLLKGGVIIDQWFYEPYLRWINNCSCDEATKNYLIDLTHQMEERRFE